MNLQKGGGFAAFYMAMAYMIGIVLFIFVLDYPHIVDPSRKAALLVTKSIVMYLTNIIMYVLFGIALIVFTYALNERLKANAPVSMRIASTIGYIWSGLLVASGMVSNAGIEPVIALWKNDPKQAAQLWSGIEAVASGLSCGNGEILGGLLTVLVSIAAFRAPGFHKALVYLGGLVGTIGIISVIPGLKDLTGIFGMSQIVWFVWLGVIMLRTIPDANASAK
jgi:hypothetical protein